MGDAITVSVLIDWLEDFDDDYEEDMEVCFNYGGVLREVQSVDVQGDRLCISKESPAEYLRGFDGPAESKKGRLFRDMDEHREDSTFSPLDAPPDG